MVSFTISPASTSTSTREDLVAISILKVLAYFDMFHYPLTAPEIARYMDIPLDEAELHESLRRLQMEKRVFVYENYYCIHHNPLLIYRRKQGNQNAAALLLKALSIGRFLFRIPFVRAIGISGSLSKNYADERADFDFFIITKSNRLWIARTLMHVLKKLSFLVGRQDWFCMNYYIDESALVIPERNIYSAIEIKTLIPVAGEEAFQMFYQANNWTDAYLPNFSTAEFTGHSKPSILKRAGEACFPAAIGDWFDNLFFSISVRRWKRKARMKKKNGKGHVMDLITGKHYARSNPGNFQEQLLTKYHHRLKDLKEQFEDLKMW